MTASATPPFDAERLDALLDGDGIDVVVATSPHNVRYLLGSYSAFHDSFDAIGVDRHLPAVGIRRGDVSSAFAVTSPLDAAQHAVDPPWVPTLLAASHTAPDTARLVARELASRGLGRGTVALEQSFAPHRFVQALAAELPGATLVEAAPVLEELRAVKRQDELALLREAAVGIVDAIAETARATPGRSKAEIVDRLRVEEARRGLRFEYCLVAAGDSFNRAASPQPWRRGEVLSLDSGGRRHHYIGDLCRMAFHGEPSPQHVDLLGEVRAVQDAARAAVGPGATGEDVYAAADEARRRLPHGPECAFVAHGMGLVPHEAPRLSDSTPIPYPGTHRRRPLEPGMVLSIETDLRLDGVGLVKLEDTVVVVAAGCEGYGDAHRDWIVVDG